MNAIKAILIDDEQSGAVVGFRIKKNNKDIIIEIIGSFSSETRRWTKSN
jgi:hypothetical protein